MTKHNKENLADLLIVLQLALLSSAFLQLVFQSSSPQQQALLVHSCCLSFSHRPHGITFSLLSLAQPALQAFDLLLCCCQGPAPRQLTSECQISCFYQHRRHCSASCCCLLCCHMSSADYSMLARRKAKSTMACCTASKQLCA